jgi:hypothetical protein
MSAPIKKPDAETFAAMASAVSLHLEALRPMLGRAEDREPGSPWERALSRRWERLVHGMTWLDAQAQKPESKADAAGGAQANAEDFAEG